MKPSVSYGFDLQKENKVTGSMGHTQRPDIQNMIKNPTVLLIGNL